MEAIKIKPTDIYEITPDILYWLYQKSFRLNPCKFFKPVVWPYLTDSKAFWKWREPYAAEKPSLERILAFTYRQSCLKTKPRGRKVARWGLIEEEYEDETICKHRVKPEDEPLWGPDE